MKIELPEDTFENVPKRAWIYISLGVMVLLILIGAAIYKHGGIYINKGPVENKVENEINK